MLNQWSVIGFSLGYAALLFAIAWWGEQRARSGRSLVNNPYIYALSLAVYCTAWTYYGSVGLAAESGLEFLTIYIGPTLLAPLWWILLRKIIRICKTQHITSLADFIAARYGKSVMLGSLVAVFCVLGIIPYIALQLKAIATSYSILVGDSLTASTAYDYSSLFYHDSAFYITLAIIVFTILFGARHLDVTERHEGMVTAIAFESFIKLVAFLAIGLFVCFGLFNGVGDIFKQAALQPELQPLLMLNPELGMSNWFWTSLVSMMAVLFLPRQFQLSVVENTHENHVKKAMWLFPLYLLVINLFVLPIALGGKLFFQGASFAGISVDADTFLLTLPLASRNEGLAMLAYIGGYSAATSMVIVSAVALSIMLSNNVSIPLLLSLPYVKERYQQQVSRVSLFIRRFNIALIILLAYAYYKVVAGYFPLVSIGLISFTAVAQFTPAVMGGIFWKGGNRKGALAGLISGFAVWFFTLVIPTIITAQMLPASVMTKGLFGIELLRPYQLFGLEGLDPVAHGLFWSLFLNLLIYVLLSLYTQASSREENQAEVFVDIFEYGTYETSIAWKGTTYLSDLQRLLINLLGEEKTSKALAEFSLRYKTALTEGPADARLINYSEKMLAGAIGAAPARIMLASVSKQEEEISRQEVFDILQETKQVISINKELQRKTEALRKASEQLRQTNARLKELDHQKDEFISTVTHEMRTPLTSIRAFSEILHDNPELDETERLQFLNTIIKETERMNRLISQVLDLEKFESGKQKLYVVPLQINELIRESIDSVSQLMREKGINLQLGLQKELPQTLGDRDRLMQVLLNLLSNAIKFCPPQEGKITISSYYLDGDIKVNISDNGHGIEAGSEEFIFDKFFQVKNQTSKKPVGSGLGLAISKQIIEHHKGRIWAENTPGQGTRFSFVLPLVNMHNHEQEANKRIS
jgi:Na+/proline symporter/nitrogen-specific signal transduction histidine kinase